MRLMRTHKLTITREGSDSDKGYYDKSGKWVNPTTIETFIAKGSLQPFKKAEQMKVFPEGTRTSDVKIFYTDADIRTTKEYQNLPADKTTIGGHVWTFFMKEDWNGFSSVISSPQHNAVVLLKDNPK